MAPRVPKAAPAPPGERGARSLAIGACVFMAASIGLLSWLSFSGGPQARELVRRSQEAIAAADDLAATLREAESGQRGFLLTGRDTYLAPYLNGRNRVLRLRERLAGLAVDEPAQRERLRALGPALDDKMEELAETVRARREEGPEAALAIVRTDRGWRRMDDIGKLLAAIRAGEATSLARRQEAAAAADSTIRWTALGFAACSAGLLGLAARLLIEARARARDLLETLDLGTFMARDLEGRITYWSRGCERLYGWTEAEAAGQSAHALLRTGFPQPRQEIEAALERNGSWEGDLRQRTRGGREITVAARKVLRRRGGRPNAVLESVADVTAERRAEAALAASEARLRLALDAGRIGTFAWTPARGELVWDARLRDIWALPPGAEVSPEIFLAWLPQADRERAEAAWQAALDPAGDGRWEVEYLAVGRRDGVPRRLAERGRVEFEGGRPARAIGTVVDITAQREAEAVLARDRAELAQLVRERTRELISAQARLTRSQRMEALGQISGGVAHDFNNVLQAVLGGATLLERRPGNAEAVRRLARMVSEAAARGTAITRRLLALSRQGELRPEPVEPAALLRDMKEAMTHSLGAAIAIRIEAEAGLPLLLADKGQLETTLVNLATNAREAMPEGGTLTLSAGLDDGAAAGLDEGGPWLRLRVADTGTGMEAATLERAAEPFFSTREGRRGSGLGLAMARGFAEQSGGALAIESEAGRGTVVSLWLPLAAVPADAAPPAAPAARMAPALRAAAGRPRVLLVDDEALVCEITAEQLEAEGFSVLRATSGPAALALLETGEPVDLVVSDLSMPGMDGLALVREARRLRQRLPAILLTGYATDAAELAVAGAVSGEFSLLRKPVDGKALAGRAAEMLAAAPA